MTKYLHALRYNCSMEVIYIDSVFLLNFVIDYLLVLASAQVCGVRLRRLRYISAALAGASYAAAVYLPRLGFLASPLLKLAAALLMSLIAFGGEARMLRCALVFLCVSAAFGGFIWALALAGGHPAFDMRTLVLSFALCYVLLRLVFSRRLKLADRPRAAVELTLDGRVSKFFALVDTGNSLADPVSGCPVMVICPHAAAPLFGANSALLELDAVSFFSAASGIPALHGRLRLIPYSAVGGGGMLAAFKPDCAVIDGKPRDILAAVSSDASGDGYEGIV